MEDLLKKLKEPLEISQVEFRVQSITKKGFATILAYKDARTDMNRLDEVCGINWQDDYKLIDGQLYCGIAIKNENEWIWRWDVGIESNTEQVKGRASDAFKRAGFRWGIGRELYDYPRIQMMLKAEEFTVVNDKGKQTYKLKLDKWKWTLEREGETIKRLTAVDQNGDLRYDSTKDFNFAPGNNSQPETQPSTTPASNAQTAANNPSSKPAAQPKSEDEKPWLNKMTKDRKNFTKQWLNVVNAVNSKKLNNVSQVREHYKVNTEIAAELEQLFNFQPA